MAISGGYLDICRLFYSEVWHLWGISRFWGPGLVLQVQYQLFGTPIPGHSHQSQTNSGLSQCNSHSNSHLVAVSTMVSTPNTTMCGSPSYSSIPPISVVSTRVHFAWAVIPSTHMEALMQHFQAAGFSGEISRLAAAPQQITCTTIGGFTLVFYHTTKICCLNQVHLGREVISCTHGGSHAALPSCRISEEGSRLPAAPGRSSKN